MTGRTARRMLGATSPPGFVVGAVVAVLALCGCAGKSSADVALDDLAALWVAVEKAHAGHDVARERRLLAQATALPGSDEDRAKVVRRQAVIAWKVDRQWEAARARLRAAAAGADGDLAWLELARLELAAGDHAASRAAAEAALAVAERPAHRTDAQAAIGRAIVERAIETGLQSGTVDLRAAASALAPLEAAATAEPGSLEPSRRLLQAAAMAGRGDLVLAAWRSYYHAAPGESGPSAVADAGARLAELVGEAAGEVEPGAGWSADRRAALAHALADSRFFAAAAMVALGGGKPITDAGLREVVAYARALRRLETASETFYRDTLAGDGEGTAFRRALDRASEPFFADAGLMPGPTEGAFDRLVTRVRERHGVIANLDRTAGYFDLHMGHAVVDERRTVEQYGRRATVRFVRLDHLVSNGFQSWAWEGTTAHGGWADSDLIVQVRAAYVPDYLLAWRVVGDPQALAEARADLERESAADAARAAADPVGYLPGLAMRLRAQAVERLLARLDARGLEGAERRLAFLAELDRLVEASSIIAHEGRHAIDAGGAGRGLPGWLLEYRAKLSQVVFAPDVRTAFGGIFGPNIGSATPHGRANARLMRDIVGWMDAHRGEIAGLDPDAPLLPQFDRLSDDQMRALFRSLDPLAR